MTTTPPESPPHDGPRNLGTQSDRPRNDGPRVSRDDIRDVTRLRRTVRADRKVAGVAGGLARHLDVDPVLIRVGFVVLAFFGGAGLLLYGALWLLLPEDGAPSAAIRLDERSLVAALIGVGALALFAVIGDSWGGWFPWPLAVIALLVVLLLTSRNQSGSRPAPTPGWQPTPPAPPGEATSGPAPLGVSSGLGAPPRYAATGYPTPAYPAPGYVPTTPAGPAYRAPTPVPSWPRDPRKAGPVLFWFTLALITLALGLLGVADVSGADVPAAAYPALATGLVGAMLLVGAFFGRAGGLILLGLISAVTLGGVAVGHHLDGKQVSYQPVTAAQVSEEYTIATGELIVDLSKVSDPEGLAGRQITVSSDLGRVLVIVPADLDVVVTGHVDGAGHMRIFGSDNDGIDLSRVELQDAPSVNPPLRITATVGLGDLEVRSGPSPSPIRSTS